MNKSGQEPPHSKTVRICSFGLKKFQSLSENVFDRAIALERLSGKL